MLGWLVECFLASNRGKLGKGHILMWYMWIIHQTGGNRWYSLINLALKVVFERSTIFQGLVANRDVFKWIEWFIIVVVVLDFNNESLLSDKKLFCKGIYRKAKNYVPYTSIDGRSVKSYVVFVNVIKLAKVKNNIWNAHIVTLFCFSYKVTIVYIR